MRLSDVLSSEITNEFKQVEQFLNNTKLKPGKQRKINIGVVGLPYFCRNCDSVVTFNSLSDLYCIGITDNIISIDCYLKCSRCGETIAVWFLVESEKDMSLSDPFVRIIKKTEKLTNNVFIPSNNYGDYSEYLNKADIAYNNNLGAGALVYLRKVYECLTVDIAKTSKISLTDSKGNRKRFKDLLKEVDDKCSIIPNEYKQDRYKLFEELSNVIHGGADESDSLMRYKDLRRLLIGIIDNIKNNKQLNGALKNLGWRNK